MFGWSPRPLTGSPFSLSAVCLLILRVAVQVVDVLGDDSPLALCQGPRPMRSRAFTAGLPPAASR